MTHASTQAHTNARVRTLLGERSDRRRDLYMATRKHSQETDVHATGDIQTHDPRPQTNASDRVATGGHTMYLFTPYLIMISVARSLTQSFRPHYDLGVDSACNRNEYQEYLLG